MESDCRLFKFTGNSQVCTTSLNADTIVDPTLALRPPCVGPFFSAATTIINMKTGEPNTKPTAEKRKAPNFKFGPALLVTAAFIGPGTVLTASKAGANYGFALVWAIVFSVVATVVLQEMAARLGIISGGGLAQAVRDSISTPIGRFLALGLVLGAILLGNAAYQTGNLLGAATGLAELWPEANLVEDQDTSENATGDISEPEADSEAKTADDEANKPIVSSNEGLSRSSIGAIVFGAIALVVIWIGRLDLVQGVMVLLVVLMSLMFVFSAIACRPNWGEVFAGMIPSVPASDEWAGMSLFVIGLIGTTVVPYNLFLHASSASEKWHEFAVDEVSNKRILRASLWDTILSVVIGGVVTASILITMAVAFKDSPDGLTAPTQIAGQLRQSLGDWAGVLFAIGLCAAGLTSSITAPIAAAYATAGCFNWPCKLSDIRLKLVATLVVATGVIAAVRTGKSPMQVIILAQVANGLLLPLVAIFLLYVTNQSKLMGKFKNSTLVNILAVVVILITLAIAVRNFNGAIGNIKKLMAPAESVAVMEASSYGTTSEFARRC